MRSRLLAGLAAALLLGGAADSQTPNSALPPASAGAAADIYSCSQATGVAGHWASRGCTAQQAVENALVGPGAYLHLNFGSGVADGYLFQGSGGNMVIGVGEMINSAGTGIATATSGQVFRTGPSGIVFGTFSGATVGQPTPAMVQQFSTDLSGDLTMAGTGSFGGTVTAPTFVGNLAGTANNANTLDGEGPQTGAVANSVVARDPNGNVTANAFLGTASSASSVPAGTITAGMMAGGAAAGNLGYRPLNSGGDTSTGAQNTSVNVGSAPASVDAGQMGAMIDLGYGGEQRAVTWGVAPDGSGYLRAPHGPLELWANATDALQISQSRATWIVSPALTAQKFGQLDSAPGFGESAYITDCPASPQSLGYGARVTAGGGTYDCKLWWNAHDGAWEVGG